MGFFCRHQRVQLAHTVFEERSVLQHERKLLLPAQIETVPAVNAHPKNKRIIFAIIREFFFLKLFYAFVPLLITPQSSFDICFQSLCNDAFERN